MELEHRFDLPVGIDRAWAALTDVRTVAQCFPGAHLDSVEGDTFSGSLKFKAGPVRLSYKGTARFVEKDDLARTATIEATGAEGSASNATVLVTATAKALSPSHTQVDLVTTLSLTGRPAEFGRPLMVEVGNRHISQFADAVSTTLAGRAAGGAELVDVENPDEIAAEREQALAAGTPAGAAFARRLPGGAPTSHRAPGGTADVLRRVLPAALLVVGVILLRKLLRRDPGSTTDA